LQKSYSHDIFVSPLSNFFARCGLLRQSNANPEGFRLPLRVLVPRKSQGSAGEF
jgi:hypothetical protein